MMVVPAGVKVHLALGYTDMRKGMDGLAALVQEQLKKDPFSGHLFSFRGKKASTVKVLFWDGNGLCLFTKRIDRGGFVWPRVVDHLPREDVVVDVPAEACPCCGGAMHSIGESVSEMLDWTPEELRVVRITRPKYACRTCEMVVQAPAPERPIAGGLATPGLLAHVLVSKYCDHTPLYRQSQIFARHGVDLERSSRWRLLVA